MFKVKDKRVCRKIDFKLAKEIPDYFYGKQFECVYETFDHYVIVIGVVQRYVIPKKFCDKVTVDIDKK